MQYYKMMNKKILTLISLVVVGLIIYGGWISFSAPVTSFEACALAGHPIMESYPRQCRAPDGTLFVEKIEDTDAVGGGTIHGIVLLGPTCPVMREPADPACADKPYATELSLTTQYQSSVVKEFSSDANGKFSIEVPAGDYSILSRDTTKIFLRCGVPGHIHVEQNSSVEIKVMCDTGIR